VNKIEKVARAVCLWHIGKPDMWDGKGLWEGPPKEDYYEAAKIILKSIAKKPVKRGQRLRNLNRRICTIEGHEIRINYKVHPYETYCGRCGASDWLR